MDDVFSPANTKTVMNLMEAEEEILDGQKPIPEEWKHTFRRGDT